jgi:hypothetical protein
MEILMMPQEIGRSRRGRAQSVSSNNPIKGRRTYTPERVGAQGTGFLGECNKCTRAWAQRQAGVDHSLYDYLEHQPLHFALEFRLRLGLLRFTPSVDVLPHPPQIDVGAS